MSLSTLRESTVVLSDYTTWPAWNQQLENRLSSLMVWELVDPKRTDVPMIKPTIPNELDIEQYERHPSLGRDADNNPIVPRNPSDLTTAGQKAWKDDMDTYKIRLESYKLRLTEFNQERAALDKASVYIQTTVTAYLARNCLLPHKSLRHWIISLRDTVGVDPDEQFHQARERYHNSLKGFTQPARWESWLEEYEQAATEAEREEVGEVLKLSSVIRDFLKATVKVDPSWVKSFQNSGAREEGMTRKEMTKRFRESMVVSHPLKGKQRRGAFAAGDESAFAASGETTQGNERDASNADDASSAFQKGSRGRPRKQQAGSRAISKQPYGDTAAAGRTKCPACGQRHKLNKCFYINSDEAPEWFIPRPQIAATIKKRLNEDTDFQEQYREAKRARIDTPSVKRSTSTPQGELPSTE